MYIYIYIGSIDFIDFEPTHIVTECHIFVEEIIDYLRVTFIYLSSLPLSAIEGMEYKYMSMYSVYCILCSMRL